MNNKDSIMNIFTALPKEIIDNILCYTGVIKERNGKYMGQIDKNDYRYKILRQIPRNIEVISIRWIILRVNDIFTISIFPRENYIGVDYSFQIFPINRIYYYELK